MVATEPREESADQLVARLGEACGSAGLKTTIIESSTRIRVHAPCGTGHLDEVVTLRPDDREVLTWFWSWNAPICPADGGHDDPQGRRGGGEMMSAHAGRPGRRDSELQSIVALCRESAKLGLNVGMSDARPAAVIVPASGSPLWITLSDSGEFFEWRGGEIRHPAEDAAAAAAFILKYLT